MSACLCDRPTSNPKFCNRSCAASFNNRGLRRHSKERLPCVRCSSPLPSGNRAYCSQDCLSQHKIERWLSGEDNPFTKWCSVPTWIRRYMIEESGNACSSCQWKEVHPLTGSVPLQMNHVDGNCMNNAYENLQVLCPNCHSLTPNFGALNGESRRTERQRRRTEN